MFPPEINSLLHRCLSFDALARPDANNILASIKVGEAAMQNTDTRLTPPVNAVIFKNFATLLNSLLTDGFLKLRTKWDHLWTGWKVIAHL